MPEAAEPNPRRTAFRERQLRMREDAILAAVNALLASKGYDLMTMDEVAAEVGIAKASLYKHFASKEELAAAAMTALIEDVLAFIETLPATAAPLERLRAVMHWAIQVHLRGQMPALPSTRATVRQVLLDNPAYMASLGKLTTQLAGWISEAQTEGRIAAALPAEMVLYLVFARTCDPVVDFMKLSGAFSDAEIADQLLDVFFRGIAP